MRAAELWWTTSNTTTQSKRARWSLGLVIQFVEGNKLIPQRSKVFWLETAQGALDRRMTKEPLPGHDEFAGEAWY